MQTVFEIQTESSRNNGNHGVNKFGLVASKTDCQALMELLFIDICIWCAHHFMPFLGLNCTTDPDWSK